MTEEEEDDGQIRRGCNRLKYGATNGRSGMSEEREWKMEWVWISREKETVNRKGRWMSVYLVQCLLEGRGGWSRSRRYWRGYAQQQNLW